MRNKTYENWQLSIGVIYPILLICILAIPSCATQGYEGVDTSRKAILVVDAEIRGANMLLQDLISRNVIDSASAREALAALRDAHTANQAALDAVSGGGDPLTAEGSLERANRALSVALILVSQFTGNSP